MLNHGPLAQAIGRLLMDPGVRARFGSDPRSALRDLRIDLSDTETQRLVVYMNQLQDGSPGSRRILARALQSCDRTIQK
jgi:hypothetical protein